MPLTLFSTAEQYCALPCRVFVSSTMRLPRITVLELEAYIIEYRYEFFYVSKVNLANSHLRSKGQSLHCARLQKVT